MNKKPFLEIEQLCKKYTNLDDEDIIKLQNMSSTIQTLSDILNSDVFIDCATRDPNEAIVIAEAKPSNGVSMYQNGVVGELALRDNEPAVLRTLELGIATKDLKAITQEHINVRQTVAPIKNNDKVIGVLIIEKDITDKINHDKHIEMLAEGYEQLTNTLISLTENENAITNHLDDAIIIFDEEGIVRFKNPGADILYEKLGYKDNLIGMDYNNISLDNTVFNQILSTNQFSIREVNVGKLFLQVKKILLNSKTFKLVMMVKDITVMKEKEKELILKSVAIKEIHHRVKNNLQTIASLLRLQARRSDNEQTKNALNESMNRILSIAATHEILAKECVDEVDIIEVITNIKSNTVRYFNVLSKNIDVNVIGDNFKVNSDKATSIALVINEILQNSLKHAFTDKIEGCIEVKIEYGKIYSTISVVDNGKGFDITSVKNNSLGLSIINSIVKDKLSGNITINSNSQGTKILFDFKN